MVPLSVKFRATPPPPGSNVEAATRKCAAQEGAFILQGRVRSVTLNIGRWGAGGGARCLSHKEQVGAAAKQGRATTPSRVSVYFANTGPLILLEHALLSQEYRAVRMFRTSIAFVEHLPGNITTGLYCAALSAALRFAILWSSENICVLRCGPRASVCFALL